MATIEVRTKIAAGVKSLGLMNQTVYATILDDAVRFTEDTGDYIVKGGCIEWERVKNDNVIYRGDNGSFVEYEVCYAIGFPYAVYSYYTNGELRYVWGVFFFEDHIIKTGADEQSGLPEYSKDVTDLICDNSAEFLPGAFEIHNNQAVELFNLYILPDVEELEEDSREAEIM